MTDEINDYRDDDDRNMIPPGLGADKLLIVAQILAESLIIFDVQVGQVSERIDMFAERVAELSPGELEPFEPMTRTLAEFARRQRVAAAAADRLAKAIGE
jgi:hypothetical protein